MKALRPQDPEQLGDIRLLTVIGQGGMGRVLLGRTPTGQLVAVKRIHRHLAGDADFRARFRREVEVGRAVTGAYTAALVDADTESEIPWLATEYLPGPSLRTVVDECGPLPLGGLRLLAAGLASALVEIHRAGLVHRDLAPANVLLTPDGPRVIDFGIARALDGATSLTTTGSMLGSPAYMSPEQATSSEITQAADVFAVGAILAMAASGHPPFAGVATPQVLYNILHTDPDLTGLPPALRELVAACLAKDPAERPSATQLLEAAGQIPAEPAWSEPVRARIANQQADTDWWVATAARDARYRELLEDVRRKRTRTIRMAAATAAALLAITCTGAAVGRLAEQPGHPEPMTDPGLALTAAELRLLDTCVLLETALVPALGTNPNVTERDTAGAGGTSCDVKVAGGSGQKRGFRLEVDPAVQAALELMKPVGKTVGWTTVIGHEYSGLCERAVITPTRGEVRNGQIVITVSGAAQDGSCTAVEQALFGVVQRLTVYAPPAQRAPNSILRIDPCSVLDTERARALVGDPGKPSFGLYSCGFTGSAGSVSVSLKESARADSDKYYSPVQAGGFTFYQQKYDLGCSATYLVRPTHDTLAEQVTLTLNSSATDPSAIRDRCDEANSWLTEILGKIPLS